ncbi:hypothetical protein EV127DRAFT_117394 [Xylaria flabelliformis]|nr:hypothetical protein EV127DRAFT_117394 [Xylaria flabelliformis]
MTGWDGSLGRHLPSSPTAVLCRQVESMQQNMRLKPNTGNLRAHVRLATRHLCFSYLLGLFQLICQECCLQIVFILSYLFTWQYKGSTALVFHRAVRYSPMCIPEASCVIVIIKAGYVHMIATDQQ